MQFKFEHNGRQFACHTEPCDVNRSHPWREEDGHGPVVGAEENGPGFIELGNGFWYDYHEACRIALRDHWNGAATSSEAEKAAFDDYKYLKAYVDGEWEYVAVVVQECCPHCNQPYGHKKAGFGYASYDEEGLRKAALEFADEFPDPD